MVDTTSDIDYVAVVSALKNEISHLKGNVTEYKTMIDDITQREKQVHAVRHSCPIFMEIASIQDSKDW